MIEEVAIVSDISNFQVSVRSTQTSSCGKCMQKEACATSLLDKYIAKRDIVVDTELTLAQGDKVLVGIDEAALIKGSVLIYLVPLFALLLGALFGSAVAEWLPGFSTDILSACFAFAFFITCLFGIKLIQAPLLMHYFARPVVIRKL